MQSLCLVPYKIQQINDLKFIGLKLAQTKMCIFLLCRWQMKIQADFYSIKTEIQKLAHFFHDELKPFSLTDLLLQISWQIHQPIYLLLKSNVALKIEVSLKWGRVTKATI